MDPSLCVLLVDDTPPLLRMYARAFSEAGFRALTAESGQEALTLAQTQPLSLILLDVMMPGLNGIETLKALKESEATKSIPVIMLSVNDDPDLLKQALDLGAKRCWVKSNFEPTEIVGMVCDELTIPRPQP